MRNCREWSYLVNPYNKNEISDAIEKIYNNDNNICELLIEADILTVLIIHGQKLLNE